jgi:NADH-quinone oxidoreductase subunit E
VDLSDDSTAIDEQTVAELRQIMARYPQPRSAIMPMLHLVQSVDGRVSPRGVEVVAELLGVTEAQVLGVATFYTMYRRRPAGKHHVGVCVTALCAVMGGDAVYDAVSEHLGIGADQTTADGLFSLERVQCNAACDFAPVMMLNWEFMDDMTPERAVAILEELAAGREVASTRGPALTSFKENERVLAGFYDGRADEGPSAGEPSLLGLSIAAEHGWTAPGMAGAAPGSDAKSRSGSKAASGTKASAPKAGAASKTGAKPEAESGAATPKARAAASKTRGTAKDEGSES